MRNAHVSHIRHGGSVGKGAVAPLPLSLTGINFRPLGTIDQNADIHDLDVLLGNSENTQHAVEHPVGDRKLFGLVAEVIVMDHFIRQIEAVNGLPMTVSGKFRA